MVQLQDYNDPAPSRAPWVILVLVTVLVLGGLGWWLRSSSSAPAPAKVDKPVMFADKPAPLPPPPKPVPVPAPAPAASNPAPAAASADIPPAALDDAAALEKAGRLSDARLAYLELLEKYPASKGRAEVEEKAGALGLELVFKPHPMAEKTDYVVGSGDTLDKIARQFNSTKELLVTNNLIAKAALIKRGDHYRVFSGTFKVTVNKSRHDLVLTLNGRFFKRYSIGTGKFGKTPAGTYTLAERIAQPVWWKPDGKAVPFGSPDNILGTHWLALKASGTTPPISGYGIHGTWDDASIGKDESAGCVRMHNADVAQLYVLLPIGTEVVIEE